MFPRNKKTIQPGISDIFGVSSSVSMYVPKPQRVIVTDETVVILLPEASEHHAAIMQRIVQAGFQLSARQMPRGAEVAQAIVQWTDAPLWGDHNNSLTDTQLFTASDTAGNAKAAAQSTASTAGSSPQSKSWGSGLGDSSVAGSMTTAAATRRPPLTYTPQRPPSKRLQPSNIGAQVPSSAGGGGRGGTGPLETHQSEELFATLDNIDASSAAFSEPSSLPNSPQHQRGQLPFQTTTSVTSSPMALSHRPMRTGRRASSGMVSMHVPRIAVGMDPGPLSLEASGAPPRVPPTSDELVAHLLTGTTLALALAAPNAVNKAQELCGPADPGVARRARPNSLRAIFGRDCFGCAILCATSETAASQLLKALFGREVVRRTEVLKERTGSINADSMQQSVGDYEMLPALGDDDAESRRGPSQDELAELDAKLLNALRQQQQLKHGGLNAPLGGGAAAGAGGAIDGGVATVSERDLNLFHTAVQSQATVLDGMRKSVRQERDLMRAEADLLRRREIDLLLREQRMAMATSTRDKSQKELEQWAKGHAATLYAGGRDKNSSASFLASSSPASFSSMQQLSPYFPPSAASNVYKGMTPVGSGPIGGTVPLSHAANLPNAPHVAGSLTAGRRGKAIPGGSDPHEAVAAAAVSLDAADFVLHPTLLTVAFKILEGPKPSGTVLKSAAAKLYLSIPGLTSVGVEESVDGIVKKQMSAFRSSGPDTLSLDEFVIFMMRAARK